MKNMMGQLEGAFAPPTIDPTEMFKTQLNSMGQDGEFKINGKPVSKEEFDKAIGSNPALQNMMGSVAQMATPGTALPEVTKTNMADDVAAKREEEAKARKMLFESMGESQDPSSPKSKRGASGSSGTTLGGQEGGPNLVELLNTKLEQLININQNIANVNNDQLRVQRNLNFSGNVYNSAG
jgi:hypothetical protein